jgi:hypothetical protein
MKRFGTPEEVDAAAERAFRKLWRPIRRKKILSAAEALDEVRKALGTPEGQCVIEWAKQIAQRANNGDERSEPNPDAA